MATVKKYLDYAGLQSYDTQIKAWANGVNQLGYKTILKSTDGNSLLLFKTAGATTADTPDATVALGSADAAAKLTALANVLGATWDSTANDGEGAYTLALDSNFASGVDTALEAINELKGAVDLLNDDAETAGSVAYAIDQAIDALDVTEFALAEKDSTTNVITIHGISESDGEIAVGVDSDNDVILAAVAATGDAADVSNAAITGVTKDVSGTPTATTNVQDTLEALKDLIDNANSAGAITIDEVSTGLGTGILKAYQIYQGGTQSNGVTSNGSLIGTVNIPKDFLVKSASVKTVLATDKASGGIFENDATFAVDDKYMDFVINTADTTNGSETSQHIYINVDDLMSALSVEANADEVQLAISATNELSADIVKVAGTKIVYKAAYTDNTDPSNPVNVPEETVVDALNNIGSIPTSGTDSIASLFA